MRCAFGDKRSVRVHILLGVSYWRIFVGLRFRWCRDAVSLRVANWEQFNAHKKAGNRCFGVDDSSHSGMLGVCIDDSYLVCISALAEIGPRWPIALL
jgi:hypothetical protein